MCSQAAGRAHPAIARSFSPGPVPPQTTQAGAVVLGEGPITQQSHVPRRRNGPKGHAGAVSEHRQDREDLCRATMLEQRGWWLECCWERAGEATKTQGSMMDSIIPLLPAGEVNRQHGTALDTSPHQQLHHTELLPLQLTPFLSAAPVRSWNGTCLAGRWCAGLPPLTACRACLHRCLQASTPAAW